MFKTFVGTFYWPLQKWFCGKGYNMDASKIRYKAVKGRTQNTQPQLYQAPTRSLNHHQ